jgi:hypothetical protein
LLRNSIFGEYHASVRAITPACENYFHLLIRSPPLPYFVRRWV